MGQRIDAPIPGELRVQLKCDGRYHCGNPATFLREHVQNYETVMREARLAGWRRRVGNWYGPCCPKERPERMTLWVYNPNPGGMK